MDKYFCRSCNATGMIDSNKASSLVTADQKMSCPVCNAHIEVGDTVIRVSGDFYNEVKEVSSHLYEQVNLAKMRKEELNNKNLLRKELTNNTLKLLIIGGGFWLGVFVAVFYMILSIATASIDLYRFIGSLFVLPVIFTLLGVFVLRTTSQISEKNFVELVKLTLNLNFKGIKFLSKVNSEDDKESEKI